MKGLQMNKWQLKLEREILKYNPNYSVKKIEQLSNDIFNYWVYECLPDVLEVNNEMKG